MDEDYISLMGLILIIIGIFLVGAMEPVAAVGVYLSILGNNYLERGHD